ncbi:diguanylate cyclase [Ideonella sp. 4Y11]|uniref:diguanylate cyclase n=1 Tax=Ideonella aquatica TaxID=2824119 RepID=A0A940YPY0_9BURK|nr:GGDEF domain-containing protein [Ideonella aquatica]MBQ0960361.1 diguanylate cyclase [Ideonella aquatica]
MPYPHPADPLAPSTTPARLLEAAVEAAAGGELSHALALAQQALDTATDRALRLQAAHRCAFCLFRLGRLEELVTLFARCWPELRDSAGRLDLDECLRWAVLAASETGRHAEAMAWAVEGVERARSGERSADLALSLNAMGACYERMGDPWQAERIMLEALSHARLDGGAQALMITLNNLAAVTIGAYHLLRDGIDETDASATLERAASYAREAAAMAALTGEPFHRVFIEGNLGEILLHQRRLDEAEPLLHRALAAAEQGGHQAQVWRIRCTLAEGDLHGDQAARVLERLQPMASDALDQVPAATQIRLHHAMYRASKLLGDTAAALRHHEAGEQLLRRRMAQQLRAQSALLVTRTEAELSRLQAERARLEAQIERARAAELAVRASQDALTGLGNRRYLDEHLPRLLRQAEQQRSELALVLIDIDHFKSINDRFGHRVGDRVLVELAQRLRQGTRSADLIARIGGEEFLVALPDTDLHRATEVCERLREQVERTDWGQHQAGLRVTVSIGLAMAPPHDMAALFDQADRALYRAKQAGRNRVRAG